MLFRSSGMIDQTSVIVDVASEAEAIVDGLDEADSQAAEEEELMNGLRWHLDSFYFPEEDSDQKAFRQSLQEISQLPNRLPFNLGNLTHL